MTKLSHHPRAAEYLTARQLRALSAQGTTVWDVTVIGDTVLMHCQADGRKDWTARIWT